jgi:peptidoglycan/LPS O-acetylase OafA/YrhL
MAAKNTVIPSLTGLRFYAAAIITYCHSYEYYFHPLSQTSIIDTVGLGSIGMTLFFTLSGFVIHYNYGEALSSYRPAAMWSFVTARFARLYPLYIFALALTLAFIPNPFADDVFWRAAPFYFTLTQDWFPLRIHGQAVSSIYVGQAWSISAEVMLYFLYIPFARAICCLKSARSTIIVIVLLGSFATLFNVGRSTGFWMGAGWDSYYDFYLSPYCRFADFLLGTLTAQLFVLRRDRAAAWWENSGLLIVSVIALIAVFAGACWTQYGHLFRLYQYSWGYAPGCAGLMYYFARNRSPLSFIVENRTILLFGDASYSLYMLNGWPLWMFSANGVSPSYAQANFRMIMALSFAAILSLGSYKYLEVPARVFVRRALDPRRWSRRRGFGQLPLVGQPTIGDEAVLNSVPP